MAELLGALQLPPGTTQAGIFANGLRIGKTPLTDDFLEVPPWGFSRAAYGYCLLILIPAYLCGFRLMIIVRIYCPEGGGHG
jgi:hypothetical protein